MRKPSNVDRPESRPVTFSLNTQEQAETSMNQKATLTPAVL